MRKLAIVSLVVLSGCSIIQVQGGGAPGAKSGPASGGAQPSSGGEAVSLKKAYDDLDAKGACAGIIKELCATNLRKAAGIEARPHGPADPVRMWNPREGANPDPEWATDWDKLADGEGYNESIAAFNYLGATLVAKADRRACEAGQKTKYDASKKTSDGLEKQVDDALKLPTIHERLKALLHLRPNNAQAFVGGWFRLELEIGKLAADPAIEPAAGWIHAVHGDAGSIRPLLAFERESRWACMRDNHGWYKKDEIAAAEGEMSKAKSLPTGKKGAEYVALTDSREFKAPFHGIDTAKVVSITREGTGGTLTLESSREEQIVLGCARTSDRVVLEQGKLQRDKSCTYGTKTWANAITLKFADLPSAEIAKGDEVHLLAQITEVAVKETAKTGAKQREDRKFAGKGTLVLSVKHGGNEVWRLQ